jgi:hypothetical protein
MMRNNLAYIQLILFIFVTSLLGCETEPEVSPNETASMYFGLYEHTRCFERSDGSTESWAISVFVQSEDYWQYHIKAMSNGFGVQERSLSLRASASGLTLESWNDCASSCFRPQVPIHMFSQPIYARERTETEVRVTHRMGEALAETDENHVFDVGDARQISTLDGSEEGWDVQWIRTRGDDILTNTLVFIPQKGVIGWTDQTGIELTQIECTE